MTDKFFTPTGLIGPIDEPDPAFEQQAPANPMQAPATPDRLPAVLHVPLAPRFEEMAAHTAPGSAHKADPYTWHR